MEGAWSFGYSWWELGSCHHMGSKALSSVSLLKSGGWVGLHLQGQACSSPRPAAGSAELYHLLWAPDSCCLQGTFTQLIWSHLRSIFYLPSYRKISDAHWHSSLPDFPHLPRSRTGLGIQAVWLFHTCRLNLSSSYLSVQGQLFSKPQPP